jgi:hypothetical protein
MKQQNRRRMNTVLSLLKFLIIVAGFWIIQNNPAQADPPPIPELSRWESQMTQYGAKWCGVIQDPAQSGDTRLGAVYYDAERVYYQIADYTGDTKWLGCVAASEMVYRDWYVLPNNGHIPGYMVFPHGLWMDVMRNQDPQSKQALGGLAANSAYASEGTPPGALSDTVLSREVAYSLQTKLLATEVGAGNFEAGWRRLAEEALTHMNRWFVTKTAQFMQPFMVGLTSEALILYHKRTGDPRVLPAIQLAMDYLWNNLWVSSAEAFLYIDRAVDSEGGQGAVKPAPDLNLLIAPAYAWLYVQTGNPVWLQRGDQVFSSGVRNAAVDYQSKQFNQSYRWSFAYVAWRLGKPDALWGALGGAIGSPDSHYRFKQPSQSQAEPAPSGHYRFKKPR